MMHGPCGVANPNSPCMEGGKCTKKFPKDFTEVTMECDGYPQYRRRDDGKYVMKNGVPLDNRHIVPYNPYLSKKYNAHINVEICSTINSCKYLYKYVYKGPDMASVQVVDNQGDALDNSSDTQPKEQDEIKKFVNFRFITASESYWHISGYDVHGREPSIQRLAVHEENMQTVYFQENDVAEAITNPKNTTLLAWFKLNQVDADAQMLKYHEIPEHYVWHQAQHCWRKRKRGRCIGHLYTTNPSQGERHYLHILLHHIPGARSFEDLKMSPDGMLLSTFKETAIAYGLLESDVEWDNCLSEASMPKQLQSLFVTILIFGQPAKPLDLWEKYKEVMGEDISQNFPLAHTMCNAEKQRCVMNEVLLCLQEELEGYGFIP